MKAKKAIRRVGFYILLAIVLIYVVFPFFWMLLCSFKEHKDIMNPDKIFIFEPTVANYINTFSQYNFISPICNSLIIAVISTAASLACGLPCAYAIARYRLQKLNILVLLVRVIPSITFLIPWFIVVSRLGIVDTYFVVSLSHMVLSLPFTIWILVPFFEGIPLSLEESAMLDGCTAWGRFWRIALPLARAGIITVVIMSFIFSWNNFMYSMVLSGNRTRTVPLAIFNFVGYSFVDWGTLMAAAVTITFPILILSLATQKYIVKGLTAGAVKE